MSHTPSDLQFKIIGMDCAEEVAVLKQAVGPIVGGEQHLGFDIVNARMIVRAIAADRSGDIVAAVARTGMKAEPWRTDASTGNDKRVITERRVRLSVTAASGVLVAAGLLVQDALEGFRAALGSETVGDSHSVPLAAKALYGLAILSGVWCVLPKAWCALKSLRPDMNLLMVIAVLVAIAIGEWFEAATVAFLFAVSLALEIWSVGRARRAVASLLELSPPVARFRSPDGQEQQLPAKQVHVGSIFIVKPGNRLPLDGRVAQGQSEVNQAPITGESAPVFRHGCERSPLTKPEP